MRSSTDLTAAFRADGLRLTPQRQLLFRLLHDNECHPTAEALFLAASDQMPGISLRTVYQTLNDLVAMGELRQIAIGGGSARFDPNVADHHHVVCTECGDVRDIYLDVGDLGRVGGLAGFAVESTDVVVRGRCHRCLAPAASSFVSSTSTTPPKEPS
jgi:Fe2+ or Zn2+ uptake regulation protein